MSLAESLASRFLSFQQGFGGQNKNVSLPTVSSKRGIQQQTGELRGSVTRKISSPESLKQAMGQQRGNPIPTSSSPETLSQQIAIGTKGAYAASQTAKGGPKTTASIKPTQLSHQSVQQSRARQKSANASRGRMGRRTQTSHNRVQAPQSGVPKTARR